MSVRTRIAALSLDDRTIGVRDRLKTGAPGFILFVAAGRFASGDFWAQWWFYVGLAMFVSAVFLEPYFGTARGGMANSAAAVGAVWSAERAPLDQLWLVFLVSCLTIFVAGLLAAVLPGASPAKALLNRLGMFGSPVVLGGIALGLETAARLASGQLHYVWLAIGSALLISGLSLRWSQFAGRGAPRGAFIVDSIAPGRLLVEGVPEVLDAGDSLLLGESKVEGILEVRVPSSLGRRAIVSIADSWRSLASALPAHVDLQRGSDDGMVGVAGPGTTETMLAFHPSKPLTPGSPLAIRDLNGDAILYQLVGQRLTEESWDESRFVGTLAIAQQLGSLSNGRVRLTAQIPAAHTRVFVPAVPSVTLPANHFRIGTIKGTGIPVGVSFDPVDRGHVAIVGMSGMGKTSVARRVCEQLGTRQMVVGLDVTGEYRTRLGFSTWVAGDYSSAGHFVHEPAGSPASRAEAFVKDMMDVANAEFLAGAPQLRTIALEEAHSFVPEWNFASRPEADSSALTARYVMQSRKFGLSFVVISQRTAVVSKSVLSQCESLIVLRTVDDTSLTFIETIVGPSARQILPSLSRYEALCFGPGFNADGPVIVSLDPPPAVPIP